MSDKPISLLRQRMINLLPPRRFWRQTFRPDLEARVRRAASGIKFRYFAKLRASRRRQ